MEFVNCHSTRSQPRDVVAIYAQLIGAKGVWVDESGDRIQY